MIALIDYNMGNLLSVSKALECAGGDIRIVGRPSELDGAAAVVLPGVGNFGDGMKNLNALGFAGPVMRAIADGKPLLGICMGMQMLLEASEEAPGVKGLGVFPGTVRKFPAGGGKVPHMGWNEIAVEQKDCRPLQGVADGSYFYFVHSYYVPLLPGITAATCRYIVPFSAAVSSGAIFATQFHPEKSQDAGLHILRNFVAMTAERR